MLAGLYITFNGGWSQWRLDVLICLILTFNWPFFNMMLLFVKKDKSLAMSEKLEIELRKNFSPGKEYFWKILILKKVFSWNWEITAKNIPSFQRFSFQKIDYTTYGLHRDQPQALDLILYNLNVNIQSKVKIRKHFIKNFLWTFQNFFLG